jgi:Domain of unknown function (DUF1902)
MSPTPTYTIDAFWDAEASVWVATSEDVIGLATEAPTIEQLTQKLHAIIPELIELNHKPSDHQGLIQFELISHRQESIQIAA